MSKNIEIINVFDLTVKERLKILNKTKIGILVCDEVQFVIINDICISMIECFGDMHGVINKQMTREEVKTELEEMK